MREIKFRAWNGKEMMDFTFGNIGSRYLSSGFYATTINDEIYEHPGYGLNPDLKIMQFTGLYDKNGKQIYEGDIVSAWSEGYNHTGEIRWMLEAMPRIIIYPAFSNQGFWKLHGSLNHNGKNVPEGQYCDDGVEVIGNIYQSN